MLKNFVLVAIAMFILSGKTCAANWVKYGQFDIDTDNIIEYSSEGDKMVEGWVRYYNNGSWLPIRGKRPYYGITKVVYNCTKKTTGTKYIATYDINGYTIDSADYTPVRFKEIVPGTVSDAEWEFFCSSR